MKKKLNTSSIMNELQEGSAFFRGDSSSTKSDSPTTPPTGSSKPTKKQKKNTKREQKRTVERSDRTDTSNGASDQSSATSAVLTAIDEPQQEDKRLTERYSFEIYSDQKETINDAKYLYYKKTGSKVSSSELIRDALDIFLTRLMDKLEE